MLSQPQPDAALSPLGPPCGAQLPSLSPKLKNGVPENKMEVEYMKGKLPDLKRKGLELKGANQVRQLTFFRTGASEEGVTSDVFTRPDARQPWPSDDPQLSPRSPTSPTPEVTDQDTECPRSR